MVHETHFKMMYSAERNALVFIIMFNDCTSIYKCMESLSEFVSHLTQYVHIWAFRDKGLILMTSGISIYGHKGESYILVTPVSDITHILVTRQLVLWPFCTV